MKNIFTKAAALVIAAAALTGFSAAVGAKTYDPYNGSFSYTDDFYGDVYYSAENGYYYFNADDKAVLVMPDPTEQTSASAAAPVIKGFYNTENTSLGSTAIMKYTSDSGNSLILRMCEGRYDLSSSDNTAYSFEELIRINGVDVTFKGFAYTDHYEYQLAAWTKDNVSYALRSGKAMTPDEMQDIVSEII